MTINLTLTNPGTRLSCAAEVAAASRPGTGVPASAHGIRGTRRVMRQWATGDVVVFGNEGVLAAYPQADLPTVKQFRVPLSIRERSS
ncbi:MAG: hypothetical protein QOI78_6925 [Actinomycetota bacterium]|jgi:hypothetical protein|nr:hypothetical protein [Actinomycetota bacterium]